MHRREPLSIVDTEQEAEAIVGQRAFWRGVKAPLLDRARCQVARQICNGVYIWTVAAFPSPAPSLLQRLPSVT
jgi:hypothetical protein